ncbi:MULTISPECIES: OpgC domain-containing protein [Bradyrhizobium]|uniref:OpgC domain-containing protein n=2 Tax=Bradyrhizobium ottawaense TaxID=931866 RepID=A0A2U8PES2_9BRAD|nr:MULTISPECIES: OpgC domain-containing protein [Bradyrhizobium]AWL96226.1 OpgC domain-containing protein [Bradyrhizobium ottawaense]MBR1288100.1 OpgC domain-containing protein [Bradyrhizobium ottawaense]MBR1328368.1 OpgC domain-containing protein [Bradyrhizobium ottawaense]MBR1333863.1 OpgC domain-containing protein [Bradyrhizobium ottawaense]MBR1364070.1 OpgC domain-containing protein [Bradyrhizobium ottawaense]
MAFLNINATLPEKGRDLRLDLFRGVANWAIFLDHIPDNVVNWVTTRNYGFSDAADLFVFISGYTASFVYARMMLERGFLVGATRLTKRVWQLYVAHIILFVIYIASISYLALRFGDSEMINEFNVAGLVDNATETLRQGLFLRFKPLNLDVLPLYIVLMGLFPPVLWFMLRKPDLTMVLAIVLWLAARHFGWNLNAYPAGQWYFNPYCWQVLFVFGAWCAMGGARRSMTLINAPITLYLCLGYLLFALVMTMAGRFPTFGGMFPEWLFSAFNPNDKTNLAPYRFLHFVVIVILVIRFVPKEWPGLEWKVFDPLIVCGQQSLAVFCVGVFLSFVGHFELSMSSGSLLAQIFVSVAGIAIMTTVAYYISWSKKQDKPLKPPPPKPAAAAAKAA